MQLTSAPPIGGIPAFRLRMGQFRDHAYGKAERTSTVRGLVILIRPWRAETTFWRVVPIGGARCLMPRVLGVCSLTN